MCMILLAGHVNIAGVMVCVYLCAFVTSVSLCKPIWSVAYTICNDLQWLTLAMYLFTNVQYYMLSIFAYLVYLNEEKHATHALDILTTNGLSIDVVWLFFFSMCLLWSPMAYTYKQLGSTNFHSSKNRDVLQDRNQNHQCDTCQTHGYNNDSKTNIYIYFCCRVLNLWHVRVPSRVLNVCVCGCFRTFE